MADTAATPASQAYSHMAVMRGYEQPLSDAGIRCNDLGCRGTETEGTLDDALCKIGTGLLGNPSQRRIAERPFPQLASVGLEDMFVVIELGAVPGVDKTRECDHP